MKKGFKRIIFLIHLWLGLGSGLVVFIVGATGCILAFEQEIRNLTEPFQFVESREASFLLPSELKEIVESQGRKVNSLQYRGKKKSVVIMAEGQQIYLNPYTGELLKERTLKRDFFRVVLDGHFYLWLQPKIGQPIIAWAVLIFVILLITGLILWWPRRWNRANRRKSFSIKWNAKFKRLNYDLHNVLGFYALLISLLLALTGLFYGFKWCQKAFYWSTSGGRALPETRRPLSDTTIKSDSILHPENILWANAQREYELSNARYMISFPSKSIDAFSTNFNPDEETYYKREFRYFDQTTLKELNGEGIWTKRYRHSTRAYKLNLMNYDIHVGALWGLPGKIIMFLGSLIATSLPVTGRSEEQT